MLGFDKYNMNPKGKKTGDCLTRALAMTLNISWEEALTEQYETSLKTKYSFGAKQTYEKILKEYGWVKQKQPRKWDNTKYLVNELDSIIKGTKYPVFVTLAGHATCVVDDTIIDTWNCGEYTVSNYWVHEDDLWRLETI